MNEQLPEEPDIVPEILAGSMYDTVPFIENDGTCGVCGAPGFPYCPTHDAPLN